MVNMGKKRQSSKFLQLILFASLMLNKLSNSIIGIGLEIRILIIQVY